MRSALPGLDHAIGIVLLVVLVAASLYALFGVYYRAAREKKAASMPTFLGILPRSWQRWVLGEERERRAR